MPFYFSIHKSTSWRAHEEALAIALTLCFPSVYRIVLYTEQKPTIFLMEIRGAQILLQEPLGMAGKSEHLESSRLPSKEGQNGAQDVHETLSVPKRFLYRLRYHCPNPAGMFYLWHRLD